MTARVEMNGNLEVKDADDADRWTEILLGRERLTEMGLPITAGAGKSYLELVIRDYANDSYYEVSQMHPAGGPDCAFANRRQIPMRSVRIS